MDVFMITKQDFEKNVGILETMVCLIDGNYSLGKGVVWMPWKDEIEDPDENNNMDYYRRLDDIFHLKEKGIHLTESLFLPDRLIWDAKSDIEILISDARDLKTYIGGLRKYVKKSNREGNCTKPSKCFPDAFVYKMIVKVVGERKELRVIDVGLCI